MSQIKAQLEALFGANKVRETPTGYRANADEVSMNAVHKLGELCDFAEDLVIKRSGTGVVVIVDVLK